jgi:hypothetical protein
MGSSATEYAPETLNDITLRVLTRQSSHVQMGMGRSDVRHSRPAMPGRMIDRDDDLGREARRLQPRHLLERRHKGRLQPLLCTLPQRGFAPGRRLA